MERCGWRTSRLWAESSRRKAEGRKQKAESRRQKAEGSVRNRNLPSAFWLLLSAFCLPPSTSVVRFSPALLRVSAVRARPLDARHQSAHDHP